MADAIYTVVLDLTDDGCIETGWRLKQGDSGLSKIVAKVVNNGVDAFDPSATPEIAFKRADGNSVLSTMVANNGYYEYTFVGNEISVAGRVVMDVTFTDSESRISTCSARFEVVENPAGYDPEGAHTYDNPVSVLVEEAKQDASDAEAWSSGTRNGEPVSSGDPTYHNNSKYWSEQANPTLLQNLQDVVLNSPTEGQALIYDATNEVWKNGNGGGSGSSTLSGLTDVNIESPISGEALIYDFLNQEWINGQAGVTNLNGLTDVVITTPRNNQVLKYDSVSSKWINATGGGGGGLLPHLYIDSEAGSTVTVVAPDSSVITPTQISSGHWECDVPSYGVYTIHAVLNGDDAVLSLTVDDVKEYHVTDSHYSYTLNVYAPTGSTIRVTATGETYTGTGAGSTAVVFALHQASTTYTIQVTLDGASKTDSVTTPSASGGTGSKTLEFGTINVTLDTEFVGETITCVNGGTTISKTASSTSLVFYPPTTGTWTISGTISGKTYSVNAEVVDLSTPVSVILQTIPEGTTVLPTDDIQTWLKCANITDKSYTTLTEVLADKETFETLLADSNACDYMARSTTWADDICSDEKSMLSLGKYTYCRNVLLEDATWESEIVGSTYFKVALDPLIPTMTGMTTPYGRLWTTYSDVWSNSYLWWIFNHNEMGGDDAASGLQTTDSWIAFEFSEPVKIEKFYLMNETNTSVYPGTFSIDASNDGGQTWETLGTYTNSGQGQAGSKTYYDVNSDDFYTNVRYHNLTTGTGAVEGHGWSAQEMQFYGVRKYQDDIINTAVGDANIYTYVDGVQTVLGTADESGRASVDFSVLPEGDYVIYSNVSKNPSNLSQGYSKTVHISNSIYGHTTEIYLMPDFERLFYWYGYTKEELNINNTGGQVLTYDTNDIYMSINSSSLANHLFAYSDSISGVSDNYNHLKGILSATANKDGFQLNFQSPYNGASNANTYGTANNGEGVDVPKYYEYTIPSGISSANVRVGSVADVVQGKVFAIWID